MTIARAAPQRASPLAELFGDVHVATRPASLRAIDAAFELYGAGDTTASVLDVLRGDGFGALEASILLKRYVAALPQPLIARAAADALVAAAGRFRHEKKHAGATVALRAILCDEALVSAPARSVLDAILRVAMRVVDACEGMQDVLIGRLSGVLLSRVYAAKTVADGGATTSAGTDAHAQALVAADWERGRLMIALLYTVDASAVLGAQSRAAAKSPQGTGAAPCANGSTSASAAKAAKRGAIETKSWKARKSVRMRGSIFMVDGAAAALRSAAASARASGGDGAVAPLVYIEPTYLLKRGRRGGLAARWLRRWFVVTRHYLLYYTSEAAEVDGGGDETEGAAGATVAKGAKKVSTCVLYVPFFMYRYI